MTEFLVCMQVTIPESIGDRQHEELIRAEARRATELAEAGMLVRLWRIPGQRANWGLWNAADPTVLHEALSSLPMFPYLRIEVMPLARHPNDPL